MRPAAEQPRSQDSGSGNPTLFGLY
jgi:hypothetical protein